MVDYISREAAIEAIKRQFLDTADARDIPLSSALVDVDAIPSADVEEVRHGRWIRVTKNVIDPIVYRCDVCGRTMKYEGVPALVSIRYPYCHCGARMDGEQDESR